MKKGARKKEKKSQNKTQSKRYHNPNEKVDFVFHFRVCLDKTYFAEIENWKYCNKIIFKYVNSTVGPIFNEKIDKKWSL